MTTGEIAKVSTCLQGIANRDPELATKYLDAGNYLEHDPRIADGVAGLKQYVGGLPTDGHPVDLIRAFQDGSYVVTQRHGELVGQREFFDVFRFENGSIIEHWAFSSEGGPPNKSGHTQIDGPTTPKDEEDTEANKAFMREYYETVHLGGHHDKIPQYFSGDYCVRHEPGVSDGVAAFMRDVAAITQSRSIDEIRLLLGQGDFVFIVARGSANGAPWAYVDLFRVEERKIVEHWGFTQAIPPRQSSKNANGML